MKNKILYSVLGLSALLSGCGGVADTLGFGRNPPDEFAVVDRPPLSLPPDFDLKPPRPGAPRPQEESAKLRASGALFGKNRNVAVQDTDGDKSDAEKALLSAAGAGRTEPGIRETIDRETSQKIVGSKRLVDELLWFRQSQTPATTVDAAAEAARIREAKEKGEDLSKGATPIIERQKSGFLGM